MVELGKGPKPVEPEIIANDIPKETVDVADISKEVFTGHAPSFHDYGTTSSR